MSADGAMLLLEGYLQKRKDTMKLRWVTYWFRLQNTTLFFYTQRNGSALHLKGNYYIYTVQSVREVTTMDGKRFKFEILMKNGKRKMLAAETAALRQNWLRHLWCAMKLSACVGSELRSTSCEASEQEITPTASVTSASRVATDARSPPTHPPPRPLGNQCGSHALPPQPVCERVPPPDIPQTSDPSGIRWTLDVETPQRSVVTFSRSPPSVSSDDRLTSSQQPPGDYDVLPCRKGHLQPAAETEGVYDFPASYWRALQSEGGTSARVEDSTENIYDVPRTLVTRKPDQVASNSEWDFKVPPCFLPL